MNDAGTVIVADVYAAGEQPIAGVDFHVRPMFGTTNGVEATLHF